MPQTVWQELGARLREVAREEAVRSSPPVRRGTVVRPNPLVVDLDGELLDAGDEDVEVDQALKTTPPAKGDIVRVQTDGNGDYLISGVIKSG